ncbi:MAG: hypothetical protein NT169_08520 [Chloroflexi bacterium]|nr:hypothetical protein [Chloroflexota bacterium]
MLSRIPVKLLIVAAALLVLGLVAVQVIPMLVAGTAAAQNVLLNAVPFILIFVAILLTFIGLIVFVTRSLNNNVSERIFRPVEAILIAGIVLGVVGMFQPWLFILFQIGFYVLFFSLLGYMIWSHVLPKRVQR